MRFCKNLRRFEEDDDSVRRFEQSPYEVNIEPYNLSFLALCDAFWQRNSFMWYPKCIFKSLDCNSCQGITFFL